MNTSNIAAYKQMTTPDVVALKLSYNAAKAVVRGEALGDIEQLASCMEDGYAKREILRILARTQADLSTLHHVHTQQLKRV
jgi:hypothetical protein